MITVDFLGGGVGGRFVFPLKRHIIIIIIIIMGARLAKMEAPLDGDASLLPPAARAASGMVRRRRLD